MSELAATVLIPTTGDRAPLLELALASVQAQTLRELEVFVIGDGVADTTRALLEGRMARDPRIRLFDHPKHQRRGEPYRHAALAEARGRIVCYLTDRDLMLPHHVHVLADLLEHADFAHTLRFGIDPKGRPRIRRGIDAVAPESLPLRRRADIPLGFAGHTLAMYRELPYGWRETPQGTPTDRYMWEQFLSHPDCRIARGDRPTLLYFKRGDHPGWPVPKRRAELEVWHARLQQPGFVERFERQVERRWSASRRFHRMRRRVKDRLRSFGRAAALRSRRPTIRDAEIVSIQSHLKLEVYWVEPEARPGASVYAFGEEVLRLDCFGDHRGQMHCNPQARGFSRGRGSRIFFPHGSIEEHVERARIELTRNLAPCLILNRKRRIRAIQVDEHALVERANWMQRRMLALLEARSGAQ